MYFVSVVSVFQVHGIKLVFHELQGYLSWSTSSPSSSFSLKLGVPSVVSNYFLTLPHPFSSWSLLVFLGYVSAWLLGSALTCSGPTVKLPGAISVWHRAVPDLFPQVSKSTQANWIGNVTKLSASWYLFLLLTRMFLLYSNAFLLYNVLFIQCHVLNIMFADCIYLCSHTIFGKSLFLNIENKFRNFCGNGPLFLEKIPPPPSCKVL